MKLSGKDEKLIARLELKAVQIRKMLLKLAVLRGLRCIWAGNLSMTDSGKGLFITRCGTGRQDKLGG